MHNFLGSLGFHARTFQWEFFQDNKIKIRKKNKRSFYYETHTYYYGTRIYDTRNQFCDLIWK